MYIVAQTGTKILVRLTNIQHEDKLDLVKHLIDQFIFYLLTFLNIILRKLYQNSKTYLCHNILKDGGIF